MFDIKASRILRLTLHGATLKFSTFFQVILFGAIFTNNEGLMYKMDLTKPFNTFVSSQIVQISYTTLLIGLLSYLARQFAENLMQHGFVTDNLNQFWTDSQAFILMGAVINIIATIFKKGVDIQNENDLTV